MGAPKAPVLFNLIQPIMLRRLYVCISDHLRNYANMSPAKFTGYQYGGRPLGLTYAKYLNANGADAMEGTEETTGLTQDQIM